MIAFSPLAPFGVKAYDVDLARPLGDAQFRAIEAAFYAGQVLALRAQGITAAQFPHDRRFPKGRCHGHR